MSPLSAAELARFEEALAVHLGVDCDDSLRLQLVPLLRARLAETSSGGLDAYLARLDAPETARDELRALAEAVTVGETFFFRGRDHFRVFAERVLPERRRGGPLRVLSAGCASGEEAYTLAMICQEAGAADVQIDAIDVNPAALAKAERARFTSWSLRELPERVRARWFVRDGAEHTLAPEIRAMVRFHERNLLAEDAIFWRPGAFDVVFCRNVFIYFTPAAMARVADRMARSLSGGGYLFLGHSETLRGVSQAFDLCSTHDTFYYKVHGGEPRARSLAAGTGSMPIPPEATWAEAIARSASRIAALSAARPAAAPAALDEALELYREERYADVVAGLRALPADLASARSARLLLAAALSNSGDEAAAEVLCDELLTADEMNAGAHYLAALCREHAGDAAGAVRRARAAVYVDPCFAMPHILLGRLARKAGAFGEARRHLTLALELVAGEEPARLVLFAGGFGREGLAQLCRAERAACGSGA